MSCTGGASEPSVLSHLEETEWDPDSYAVGLVRLRDELHEATRALAAARRGTKVLVPGAKAF